MQTQFLIYLTIWKLASHCNGICCAVPKDFLILKLLCYLLLLYLKKDSGMLPKTTGNCSQLYWKSTRWGWMWKCSCICCQSFLELLLDLVMAFFKVSSVITVVKRQAILWRMWGYGSFTARTTWMNVSRVFSLTIFDFPFGLDLLSGKDTTFFPSAAHLSDLLV